MWSAAIAELGRALNPVPGRRVLALLYAYLDTSYNEPPTGVTSVAGYVASLDEWDSVEDRWKAMLLKWNIRAFHFSELGHNFAKDNPLECEEDFSGIISASDVYAVGAALVNADWKCKDWGENAPKRLRSRYEQCLDMALRQVGRCSKMYFPKEHVSIIVCRDSTKKVIERTFARVEADNPQFLTITLGPSGEILPLQCADLASGCLRRSWAEIVEMPDQSKDMWGAFPLGRNRRKNTSVFSLRPAAFMARMFRLYLASKR